MSEATIHGETEVAVVGGGPIGIETAISFKQQGVKTILFEAAQIGDAISRWPPNTHFFSTPEHVALAGVPVQTLDQRPISGEEYLAYMRMLVEHFDLDLHNYEPVLAVERQPDGRFLLTTHKRGQERRYRARYVVFCTGGMAGPRKLGIPGEDLPHVTHYFPGPHTYFRT
ncbi:MAG: NAD(P)-binding domain-containing protein, partial [Caldilineaceae bacterium]|nr:NAD(P)-binding domain-containing protein [Caldilineaceae bacterium]